MTARQFWKENFPNKKATIFEVMEAYADHKEEALKKKLDDQLQTAEAKRVQAEALFRDCQAEKKMLLNMNRGDDGDL